MRIRPARTWCEEGRTEVRTEVRTVRIVLNVHIMDRLWSGLSLFCLRLGIRLLGCLRFIRQLFPLLTVLSIMWRFT